MNKLKIAVLDTGFDYNRHGTGIISLIDMIGNNLEFYNLKILDKHKKGNVKLLKLALNKSIELKVNIINLNLGIEKYIDDDELNEIISICSKLNILIITTNSNDNAYNYLNKFETIIKLKGVKNINVGNIYYYGNKYVVNKLPFIIPSINDTYFLNGGNSFLTYFLIKIIYYGIFFENIDISKILLYAKSKTIQYNYNNSVDIDFNSIKNKLLKKMIF